MDTLIAIGVILIWIFGIPAIFRALKNTSKATVKSIKSGGNIVQNLKEEYREMGPFEVQALPEKVEIGEKFVDAYVVRVRGLIGATQASYLSIVTSIFDYTEGEYSAVICSLDFMQEKQTTGYQTVVDCGKILPNQGYKNWIRVATIFPETLTGTRKGNRTIRILVRAIPSDELGEIEWGRHSDKLKSFAASTVDVQMYLTERGWVESQEDRDLARTYIVKIAVFLACSGGELDPAKGKLIQGWIKGQIGNLDGNKAEQLKSKLNDALKDSYAEFKNGKLNLASVVEKLRDLEFHSMNQGLVEMLVKIVGASGEIRPGDMNTVTDIGKQLSVDYEDVKAMADRALLEVGGALDNDQNIEAMLGIDPSWDKDKVLTHLRSEFAKWNGRIQALEDSDEKEKAQKMLDAITVARQKYSNK